MIVTGSAGQSPLAGQVKRKAWTRRRQELLERGTAKIKTASSLNFKMVIFFSPFFLLIGQRLIL
jgi:hypothetical protein